MFQTKPLEGKPATFSQKKLIYAMQEQPVLMCFAFAVWNWSAVYHKYTTLFIIFISISFVRIAIQYSCWLIRCCYAVAMVLRWLLSGCYGLVLFEKGLQRVKTCSSSSPW